MIAAAHADLRRGALGPALRPLQIDMRGTGSRRPSRVRMSSAPTRSDATWRRGCFMAGRISLSVGFSAMVLSVVVGTVVGVIAGYYVAAGWARPSCGPSTASCPSRPSFCVLALAAALKPSPVMIVVIIAVTKLDGSRPRRRSGDPVAARARVRAWQRRMLGLSSDRTSCSARSSRTRSARSWSRRTLTVARAILLEAYISFLGYGIQPPLPSWGNMLNSAQQYLASAPWLAIIPGCGDHARSHQLQLHRRRTARRPRCPERARLRLPRTGEPDDLSRCQLPTERRS